ncbi:sugar transferase, partial [Streptomyces hainanensis]
SPTTDALTPALVLASLVCLVAFTALNRVRGLYRPTPTTAALDELPPLLAHSAIAWCVAATLLAERHDSVRTLLLVSAQTLLAVLARGAVHGTRRRAARRRPLPTLIVGTGAHAQRVAAMLQAHPEFGMRPVALVGPVPERLPERVPLPVLPLGADLGRAVPRGAVRHVVFARPPRPPLLRPFWERGCAVWWIESGAAGARLTGRPSHGHLWGYACRRLDPPSAHRIARWAKRGLDVAVSGTALVAVAPLLLLCAVAVRLSDGPGVIFRQERVGEDGRPFVMLKFRSLRPADDQEAATRWNISHDGRMSAVGRLLRRTSLDELPQLWNVLRGDMSLVGPRPERPHFVDRFSRLHPGYADRHRMPVGLTGLAQVSGLRGDTSIEDRTRFDNLYIETWSLWQDVRIMLRTAVTCLRLGGS